MKEDKEQAIIGCILGTAVGDALGLCCEGLSQKRLKKLFPEINNYHFLFNKGMVSDDTEHTCMVAQTLLSSKNDPEKFTRIFAWKLRFWLLGLPAGIGIATLKSIIKLWIGFSPFKSGIFSAGNGPAMRSAIFGVCFGDNPEIMRRFVSLSTKITHSDPKAEYGAMAVAFAAYMSSRKKEIDPDEYFSELCSLLPEANEFIAIIKKVVESVKANETTEKFAADFGLPKGITGYIYHTVPVVIHCWLRNYDNYKSGVQEIINCGGDTDTTAAILGGIIGAYTGKEGIPPEFLNNLIEWPRTVSWMEDLGQRLAKTFAQRIGVEQKPIHVSVIAIFMRNIFFLIIVLVHGFRRLLPPY